jgi:hypothetical protein
VPRAAVILAGVVIACAAVAGSARADDDPASDILVEGNLVRPTQGTSADLIRHGLNLVDGRICRSAVDAAGSRNATSSDTVRS